MDEDFILEGLRSNYLDFMLPFDILFHFFVLESSIFNKPSFQLFESKLAEIKEETLEILHLDNIHHQLSLSFTDKGELSIFDTERYISDYLLNDAFYNKFYHTEYELLQLFSANRTIKDSSFIKFNTLKKAMDIF